MSTKQYTHAARRRKAPPQTTHTHNHNRILTYPHCAMLAHTWLLLILKKKHRSILLVAAWTARLFMPKGTSGRGNWLQKGLLGRNMLRPGS